jgi:protein-disulfide isomerase
MKQKLILFLVFVVVLLFSPTLIQAQTDYNLVTEKIHYDGPGETFYSDGSMFPPQIATGSNTPKTTIYIYGEIKNQYTQLFFKQIFSSLLNKYSATQFVYIHDPISIPYGEDLNVYAKPEMLIECIAQQNQFWPNLELIVNNIKTNQGLEDVDSKDYTNYANYLSNLNNAKYISGIDNDKLQKCLSNPITEGIMKADISDEERLGLSGQGPDFIIKNNSNPQAYAIKINGAQDISIFDQAIKEVQGDTPQTEEINNLQTQVTSQSQQISFLQSQINMLRSFIDRLLHALHLK